MSQAAAVSRFKSLAFPFGLCTFLNPFLPPPFLFQMVCIRYIMSCTIRPHLQSTVTPCLFSYTYILGHTLGMQAFTFLLCVLALCMIYVYINLFALFWCDCHSLCHLRQVMPNFCRESKVTCRRIFAVEIWYFVECLRKAQIGTTPIQKPNLKAPMHAKPRKPLPKSCFYYQFLKIKVLSK